MSKTALGLLLGALALVVTACGGAGAREQAIADLRGAGWSEQEATCYVDATIETVGVEALDPTAELSPERLDAMYAVTSRCRLAPEDPLELDESIGYGELTERDLNNSLSEMTEEELIEWASLYGFDAGPLSADVADLRDDALDDLIITRHFELVEAQCIVDFLYRRLGKAGLDLGAAPTAEVVATEAEAIAACAPGR